MTLLPPTTCADCAPVRAGSDAGGVGQGTPSVVPAGACAGVLQAPPSELLPVEVAGLVFCRMLAPGLIVTSARYTVAVDSYQIAIPDRRGAIRSYQIAR